MTDSAVPDYYWRSLRYFCYYRLTVAGLLILGASAYAEVISFGAQDTRLFLRTAVLYFAGAIAMAVTVHRRAPSFSTQLTLQALLDIFLLTLLMYASGGQKSGLGMLMLVTLAGSGLVGEGRMVLFFASVASVAMLLEQGWRTLRFDGDSVDFFRTGLICVSFFVMAITARLLARRVVANEELARARGRALDRQLAIGRRIIADMTDGVLVLDERGYVQQSNSMAERLLQLSSGTASLRDWSPYLAHQMHVHTDVDRELSEVIRSREGKLLRLRLLPATAVGGDAIVYVEDMERIQNQAQQLKLAALGRLTANIAHEIRNPLAAISHAAELIAEDEIDPGRRRLAKIIGDNSQRLNRLVTDVLQLGRRDQAVREAIRWDEFLTGFLEEFALHDASASTRVAMFCVPDPIPSFRFDRGHLHRVLWNLLVNALRHATLAAGAVKLTLVSVDETALELHIEDDGPGIDGNIRKQMFEPFITSHGKGTGLGLYIARELCEINDARLEFIDPLPGASLTGAHFVLRMSIET